MACQAKKHSSFTAVVMVLILQAAAAQDVHLSFINVSVFLNVEFDQTCSVNPDIISTVTLPQGSNLLNVLEYANQQSDSIMEFEVFYLQSLGYQLFSINQLNDTVDCCWVLLTNPDISSSDASNNVVITKSLDDLLVSNFGFEVTYRYVSNLDCANKPRPIIDFVLQNTSGTEPIPEDIIGPSMFSVSYQIQYPIVSCPPVSGVPSTIMVGVPEGSSALNVLENGARTDPQRSFIAKNLCGVFYSIEIIGSMNNIPSCQWCPLFSPPNSAPAFPIIDINNYIIPVSGGILTLQYRDVNSCSSITDAINAGNITDEILEACGIDGASTVMLCPPLMILTIIMSFLIKFYM